MGQTSGQFNINRQELKDWLKNALLFSAPALIIFLSSLQTGGDLHLAAGAAYSAFLSALIGLLKTYLTDNSSR